MKKIAKLNCEFIISDKHVENNWFIHNYPNWEQDTFHILQHYSNKNKSVYLDIGAWIGPTVLYSANIYDKVIAIEPDPVALQILKDNIFENNFNNIVLIEKGLSDKNGTAMFGGNGELGNSMSSLIIANANYEMQNGFQASLDHSNIIQISTVTIEQLLGEQNINAENISLIKMDIEGGELILIPYLKNFLQTYKPVFYISLHYVFLKDSDIIVLIDILFEIYDNCFLFDNEGNKKLVDKSLVLSEKYASLVFE